MKNEQQIYRNLQIHLDKLPIGFPPTKSGVELEILKHFFTPFEVKLALCLTLSKTSILKIKRRMYKKYNEELDEQQLTKKLDNLYMKGSINRTIKNNKKFYSNSMLAIGMFEFHVIQVANCVCKQGSALIGKPCKQTDNIEICLIFNGTGYQERGQSRKISKDECLKILDQAEERGLVLQPGNTYEPFCICLCCGCCCEVLTTAKKFDKPAELFATNYYVDIKTEACIGCGICIKRCQMDALTLIDNKVMINLDRCIGCGLCVTKCPNDALYLTKKDHETVPPKNIVKLYLSILSNKVGKKKMMLNMLKLLIGRQI
ncbi:hypothetical protein B6U98_00185 [Thermoplasmatales archaeon ex4572_165]|nr:MAG: hypothetical protein B6U98_00185 [Thermoplasmatales archaeon ex4572_165]